MRITNTMMINNSLANIAVNKNQLSTLDTQMSTKKKINWPFSLRVTKSRLPGTVKNKRPISSISRVMPR